MLWSSVKAITIRSPPFVSIISASILTSWYLPKSLLNNAHLLICVHWLCWHILVAFQLYVRCQVQHFPPSRMHHISRNITGWIHTWNRLPSTVTPHGCQGPSNDTLFVQQFIQVDINALHYWPFVWGSHRRRWITITQGQECRSASKPWFHQFLNEMAIIIIHNA